MLMGSCDVCMTGVGGFLVSLLMTAFSGLLFFFCFFTSHLRHDTPRHIFFWNTGQDHIGYIYRHGWDDTEPT